MAERIRFYFDPICPWCYQTSKWAKRLERLGEVELRWAAFSLEAQNAGQESAELAELHSRSTPAMRIAVRLRERHGHRAVGDFYSGVGRRFFDEGAALNDAGTLRDALAEARIDRSVADEALADEETMRVVIAEHRDAAERMRVFGVPTLVLDDGEGPAIFGPVVYDVPDDATAVELFRHVLWLTRYENFAELKRERTRMPDLELVRRWRARSEATTRG